MSRLYVLSSHTLSVGSPAAINNTEPFTLMCWGYPLSDTAVTVGGGSSTVQMSRLMVKDGGVATGYWIFRVATDNGIDQLVFFKNYATTDLERRTATSAFSTKQWNHFALTWDGGATASNVHIYVNGVETTYVSTTDGVGAKQSDVSTSMELGNRGTLIAGFNGTLGYFQINGYVMSVGEIRQNMFIPGSSRRSLKGFWPTYGFSTLEGDYSENLNTATVTGTTSGALQPPINGVGVVHYPGMAY